MDLDWDLLRSRYGGGAKVATLTGGSYLEILRIDDEAISVRHRLWRDSITRKDLETAVSLLREEDAPRDAIGFAETLRRYQLQGEDVNPGCSRIPNLCAVVLKDLGYLSS